LSDVVSVYLYCSAFIVSVSLAVNDKYPDDSFNSSNWSGYALIYE